MGKICKEMSLDLNIYKNGQMIFIGGMILFSN